MLTKRSVISEIDRQIDRLTGLFTSASGLLPHGVKLEADLEFICFLSGASDREMLTYPAEYWDRVGQAPDGVPVFVWHEMLAEECATTGQRVCKDLSFEDYRATQKHYFSRTLEFSVILENLGVPWLSSSFDSCLRIVVYWRVEQLPQGQFAEKLESVICAGGIPCGLEGDRADGDLLVYWPHDIEPVIEGEE